MHTIKVFDRKRGKLCDEIVFGGKALRFLLGDSWYANLLRSLITSTSFPSAFVGFWQRRFWTKRKILPFIQEFSIDVTEFEQPVSAFTSFDDFFSRRLKREARPIASEPFVMPADGRYRFFSTLKDPIFVKEREYSLETLLGSATLANTFEGGSGLLARLCPFDYHRFHFPCEGVASSAKEILGNLASVNPWATTRWPSIFSTNKRQVTTMTCSFGTIAMVEVGATSVGTIHQIYTPETKVQKGEEKGYFSFGGSAVLVLFPKNTLQICDDLVPYLDQKQEVFCQMGEPLGTLFGTVA